MLKPYATMLVYVIASHDFFEVLKFLEQDSRFAQYIPVNYNIHIKLLINILLNYNYYLIYIFTIFILSNF